MSYLRKLNKAYAQLSKAKNFDDLLRTSVKSIQSTLGFDRAGILLFDAETNEQVGTWGIDATGKLRKEHGLRYPITDDLITLQSNEVIRLVRNKSLNDLGEVQGVGWHVQAVIFSGDDLFGWLFVDNLVKGKDITKEEYEVLETFSTVLGQLIIRTKIEDTLLEALDSLATHETRTSDALSQIQQLKAQIVGSQNMVKLGEKLSGLVPMSTRYIGNLANFVSLLSPSQFDASNLDLLDSAKTSANRLSRIFKFVDARVHEATDNDQQQLATSVVEDYWKTQFLPMFRNTPHELTIQSSQPDQVINIPLI
ncbi:GAF domain-containing protein, partial [Reinekea sp.]